MSLLVVAEMYRSTNRIVAIRYINEWVEHCTGNYGKIVMQRKQSVFFPRRSNRSWQLTRNISQCYPLNFLRYSVPVLRPSLGVNEPPSVLCTMSEQCAAHLIAISIAPFAATRRYVTRRDGSDCCSRGFAAEPEVVGVSRWLPLSCNRQVFVKRSGSFCAHVKHCPTAVAADAAYPHTRDNECPATENSSLHTTCSFLSTT